MFLNFLNFKNIFSCPILFAYKWGCREPILVGLWSEKKKETPTEGDGRQGTHTTGLSLIA
jgi:hypothetical protein